MSALSYAEFPAPPPLDGLIQCIWFLRGPLAGAAAQPVVPDGRVELVLHLAEPFAQLDGQGVARGQAEVLLAGQLTAPIHLLPQGDADVIGIRFRSASARSVLRFPADELTGRVLPLAELDARLARELLGAAQRGKKATRQGGNEAMVTALSETLASFVRQEPAPLVTEAVRSLAGTRAIPVRTIAARLGVTPRTLERRMLDEVGLAPRMLHRVFRFRRALALLTHAPRGTWSRAAIRAGYFDQSHLIRDFSRFAGMPPSAFLGIEAPLSRAIQGSEDPAA